MYKFLLLLLAGSLSLALPAQTKSTLTHEAMWMMKRVGAPEVSPDGSLVIFSVQDPSYNEKDITTDLWIVPADGSSKPRRLTFGKSSESGYKWSPDSRYIAFSAKREQDEVSQVYIMNVKEGGEAQRLTNISTGAAGPQWSPDGKMILFTNKVYPNAFTDSANKKVAEDRKKLKYNARVYTSFPIRNFDQWIDDRNNHAFVQSIEPGSTAKDIFTSVSAVVKEGFNFGGGVCWAPNGTDVIFSAVTDLNTAAYQEPTAQLFKVSILGGDAVQLTNDGNNYTAPAFTPNGKYLLCQSEANNNNKVYNLAKLVRFDWPSFTNRTVLAASLDRPINSFRIAGNDALMSIEDQGNDRLAILNIVSGQVKPFNNLRDGSYTATSISLDGKTMVSSYENASMPAEIVKLTGVSSPPVFLSSFNDSALAKLDLQQPEVVWFTSSRGKKIKSLLVRPAGFDPAKKYPLFVVMHGGPAGAWKNNWGYRWNYHLLASPGYVVLLTDYTGSTGYGEKFSQDIQFDPLKGPADEINEAAADAIKRFAFIDGSRQAAGGGSYGGHLANWMQATTTHYKCLISHAGMVNSEAQYATSDVMFGREVMNGGAPWSGSKAWQEQNPIRFAARFKTPMLITVGERDYRVPLNNSIENFGVLQRLKVPSRLVVFPEENHWILKPENSRYWYKEVHDWLKKYL
jgi:dipeptidyl aminopeptidase/acylaminoacyl peptidase